jgi:flagellin
MAVINTNTSSLNAQRNLNSSATGLATSLQRLSSGLRINSAKDDAAGLAISERMTSQIRGTNQAARNANDGISLAQTAEGDLTQIGNNLQRMRELAVQSANGTNTSADRAALDKEVQQLSAEIDRTALSSSFNGVKLLDGSFGDQQFQVGANAGETISMTGVSGARTSQLGQFTGFNNETLGTITGSSASSTLTIGLTGGTNVTVASVGENARDIANAVNNAGVTGLTATATAAQATGSTSGADASALDFTTGNSVSIALNGVNISVGLTANASSNVSNTMSAINAVSASTGVVATDTGSGLKLTAADGRNVDLGSTITDANSTGASLADLGLDGADGITAGTVKATYVKPEGSSISAIDISSTAMASSSKSVSATGTSIAATNVLTAENATKALTSIDAALASVNSSRAALGAVQNRFSSVVTSLQTTNENLSASRSRIQDTDFAAETANLTRGQILQQAGTAMLAQANSLPNGVLSLLRG